MIIKSTPANFTKDQRVSQHVEDLAGMADRFARQWTGHHGVEGQLRGVVQQGVDLGVIEKGDLSDIAKTLMQRGSSFNPLQRLLGGEFISKRDMKSAQTAVAQIAIGMNIRPYD